MASELQERDLASSSGAHSWLSENNPSVMILVVPRALSVPSKETVPVTAVPLSAVISTVPVVLAQAPGSGLSAPPRYCA
jgi:hypothetical protein